MDKLKKGVILALVTIIVAIEITTINKYMHSETVNSQQGVCLIRGADRNKGKRINTFINYLFHHRKK